MKMPKAIFVAAPADFTRFEECLKSLAEKYLSPTWEWTYKVNGKVQQEIEKKDPENEGVQIIKKTTQKEEKHDISSFRTPQRESGSGSVSASGRRIPPPPSGPPCVGVACGGGCVRKKRLANCQIARWRRQVLQSRHKHIRGKGVVGYEKRNMGMDGSLLGGRAQNSVLRSPCA